MAVVTMAIV